MTVHSKVLENYLANNLKPGSYNLNPPKEQFSIIVTQNKKVFIHDYLHDEAFHTIELKYCTPELMETIKEFVIDHRMQVEQSITNRDYIKDIINDCSEYLLKLGYNDKNKIYFDMLGKTGEEIKVFADHLTTFATEAKHTHVLVTFMELVRTIKNKVDPAYVNDNLAFLKQLNYYNIQSIPKIERQKLNEPWKVVNYILNKYHGVYVTKLANQNTSLEEMRNILNQYEAKQNEVLKQISELTADL